MGLFDRLFGRKRKNNIDGFGQEYYDIERENDDIGNEQIPGEGQCVQENQPIGEQKPESECGEKPCGCVTENGVIQNNTEYEYAPEKEQPPLPREEYISAFRKEYRHHFPKSLDTIESHMQLPYMIGLAVDISPVKDYAANEIYAGITLQELSEKGRSLVAKTAMVLEKYIESADADAFSVSLSRAHEDSLEKAWIVLDFYCRMLKADYIKGINMLYGVATDEVIKRKSAPGAAARNERYEDVLAKCAEKIAEGSSQDEIRALKKRLFQKLCDFCSIYLIHDETFNNSFPYIGVDGKIELQTNARRAEALKAFLEKNGDSKVSITEYKKDEYEKLFSRLLHNGLTVIRLDNGLTPVEIDIGEIFDSGERNLIELCNRHARRMFISELQYGYRLKNLQNEKNDSEEYKILSSAMIKSRTDGYRALASGLVYVFNTEGQRPGTTLYTRSAIEEAAEIMKVMGIVDESTLIAEGDNDFDVYEGEISLRSVSRKGSADGKGYVCAFTDRKNAEKIYRRFTEAGANDAIVVMTLNELCRNCAGTAGFILDMSSYGLEIPAELFGTIGECVKSCGIITGNKNI